ncbi:NADP-dependent malic enzyme [Candidatus Woesearchaeota archaeon]|nr:NADP-dependent malic enzyme [Candidatus Woesearchaeota archaeon]
MAKDKDTAAKALELHSRLKGKIGTAAKFLIKDKKDLSLAYTPGVAEPCKIIAKDKSAAYRYTMKGNSVAVVSDGSAVLGLGNIGPEAAIPVMEGKCLLFRQLAKIDAFPICLDTQETEEIIAAVKVIAPVFGGINLEDIAAPKCFYIEERLRNELQIPVIHDDQRGTSVVVLAALMNALKVTGKTKEETQAVISGAGAAGIAVARALIRFGLKDIVLVDSKGAVYRGRKGGMNSYKEEIAKATNRKMRKGGLGDAVKGADVFIGVSAPGILSAEMVRSMNRPIIFAMANPVPEIMPGEASKGSAAVIATGRSDFPNQINNSLSFPGLFRGTLDSGAKTINEEMLMAAASALAGLVKKPAKDRIIPDALDTKIVPAVSKAVYKAAFDTGVAGLAVK